MLTVSLLSLQACQTPTSPKTAPAPPAVDPAKIQGLLTAAETAERAGHYDEPPQDNAVHWYRAVLAQQPENPLARRGIERLADRYLGDAQRAAERQQFSAAAGYLSRARRIDPNHPALEATQAQITLFAQADRQRLRIDREQLRTRDQQLLIELARLGANARGEDCRTEITAPSDADGRWIYQGLARAVGERRIRAQVAMGQPPSVEVVCF